MRTIGGAVGVGMLGATVGWGLAHRLARAGAKGIDVVAALRPETHETFIKPAACPGAVEPGLHAPRRLSSVDAHGTRLPGVCTLAARSRSDDLTRSQLHERAVADDEGLAVAASEF